MQPVRISRLLALALAVAVGGWAVLALVAPQGIRPGPVPALADAVVLVIAAGTLVAGLRVRSYLRGRRPGLDPVVAARTAVLAQAAALTGALLVGWYGSQVLVTLGDLEIAAFAARARAAGAAVLCALVLGVVGVVVERWCRIDAPHDDEPGDGQPA